MDLSNPFFSIVIPCFNRADSVGPTLRSCRSQTFPDYEVIVVDDGSTDNLKGAVEAIGDSRFLYVKREKGGANAARNTGIDAASGRYIALLDSDDLFLPSKLQVVHDVLMNSECDLVYSYIYVDRGVGRYWVRPTRLIGPDEDVGEYLFACREVIPTPTIVVKTEIARAVRFDPALTKLQDVDFCLRLQANGHRFRPIDRVLAVWTDRTLVERVSHSRQSDMVETWFENTVPRLTTRARIGFRATVLSYESTRRRPIATFADIVIGLFIGHVPFGVTVRAVLRAYLPQKIYRPLVNLLVRAQGKRIVVDTLEKH